MGKGFYTLPIPKSTLVRFIRLPVLKLIIFSARMVIFRVIWGGWVCNWNQTHDLPH